MLLWACGSCKAEGKFYFTFGIQMFLQQQLNDENYGNRDIKLSADQYVTRPSQLSAIIIICIGSVPF